VINSAYASFGKREDTFDEGKHARLIQYLARGMTQAEFKELVESLEHIPNHINGWVAREKFIADSLNQYRHTPSHYSPFTHTCITLQCTVPIAIHAQLVKHTVGFPQHRIGGLENYIIAIQYSSPHRWLRKHRWFRN
jgi:thymidylate synthase (FAD)